MHDAAGVRCSCRSCCTLFSVHSLNLPLSHPQPYPSSLLACAAGNSLFEALSLAIWGTPAAAPTLRSLAVAHAATLPSEYRCFLGDDWDAYLAAMARPGTPGDELMLRAVGDHFCLPINIATSDAFMW